ncbi:MAG: hypothetical protein VXY73_12800 [Pseudomonadota bacterium]|jgi:hypothetical protein|nr:hypothetical protein [Pseudomonadota bacterium]
MFTCRVYKDNCWICGDVSSLTGEHKVKKSHLMRSLPEFPALFLSDGLGKKEIQGPNSRLLKYNATICKACNNSRTQGADRAYDEFIERVHYIFGLESIQDAMRTNPELPIKYDLENQQQLARYFGKHLGCALAYQKLPVPKKLSKFVLAGGTCEGLSLQFRAREDYYFNGEKIYLPVTTFGGAWFKPPEENAKGSLISAFSESWIQYVVSLDLTSFESNDFVFSALLFGKGKVKNFSEAEGVLRGAQ